MLLRTESHIKFLANNGKSAVIFMIYSMNDIQWNVKNQPKYDQNILLYKYLWKYELTIKYSQNMHL